MLSLKGKYELQDLKNAFALHSRVGIVYRVAAYILAAAFFVFVLWTLFNPLNGIVQWPLIILLILLLGFIIPFQFYARSRQIKKNYEQNKELSSPFEMELTDEGYGFKNEFGSVNMPWGNFVKYRQDDKIIMLYRTDVMFNMVPKRLLAGEADAGYIVGQLEKNGVKEFSKARRPAERAARWTIWIVAVILLVGLVYLNLR